MLRAEFPRDGALSIRGPARRAGGAREDRTGRIPGSVPGPGDRPIEEGGAAGSQSARRWRSSRIPFSSPSTVSGYMRLPMISRVISIDWV